MADESQVFPINPHAGLLVLKARSDRTRSSIAKLLTNHRTDFHRRGTAFAAQVPERELAPILSSLSHSLSEREVDECAGGFVRTEADVQTVHERPLRELIAEVQGHWLWELIENSRLTCHFQPIVSVQGELKIVAYECLLRATDMRQKEVSAGRLLRAARDAKILPILDTASHLTAIQDATAYGIQQPIFLNVSPLSVVDPLYDTRPVIAAARRSGIPAGNFVFEVTESETLEDFAPFLSLAKRFRRLGVRVALDDLGAGYASLNLLPQLEPDFVKFDMQLIRGVESNRSKGTIFRKLVELADDLGIPTIAEGVETAEQWDWIQAAGVHWAQGYLMARPGAPPPLLDANATVPLYRPAVRPLLDLYLTHARRRLADLTAMLVSPYPNQGAVAVDALQEFEGSLEVLEILRSPALDAAPRSPTESVFFISSTGGVQFHSPVRGLLGYNDGSLVDADLFSLVHPQDLPDLVADFDRGFREPTSSIQTAVRFRHANGQWVTLRLRGYTKLWEGTVGGFVIWLSNGGRTPARVVDPTAN